MSQGPGGGVTAYVGTWALGTLKPGQTKTFLWAVTPVRTGNYRVGWTVSAGLNGTAKAKLPDGRIPQGGFPVSINGTPAQTQVTERARSSPSRSPEAASSDRRDTHPSVERYFLARRRSIIRPPACAGAAARIAGIVPSNSGRPGAGVPEASARNASTALIAPGRGSSTAPRWRCPASTRRTSRNRSRTRSPRATRRCCRRPGRRPTPPTGPIRRRSTRRAAGTRDHGTPAPPGRHPPRGAGRDERRAGWEGKGGASGGVGGRRGASGGVGGRRGASGVAGGVVRGPPGGVA